MRHMFAAAMMIRAIAACISSFLVFSQWALAAPIAKRSGVDTTLRLGQPLPSPSVPESQGSTSSIFNSLAPTLHQGGPASRRIAPVQAAAGPLQQSTTSAFRPFILPRPLYVAQPIQASTLEGRVIWTYPNVYSGVRPQMNPPSGSVFLAASPQQPGPSQPLAATKALRKARLKRPASLWSMMDADGSFVKGSSSSTRQRPAWVEASKINNQQRAASELAKHDNPTAATLWNSYSSKYLDRAPPQLIYQDTFFPQAARDLQARIDALLATKR